MIYFITADKPEGYPIKIGYTADFQPWERLDSLQTANPYKLKVLAVIRSGHPGEEARLHNRFKSHRLEGEWFDRHDELMDLIAESEVPLSPPEKLSAKESGYIFVRKLKKRNEIKKNDMEARSHRARTLLSQGVLPHEVSKEVGISIKGVCKLRDKPMVKLAN